jgi:hypothetical protein
MSKKKTYQFSTRKEATAFTKKRGGTWKIEKLGIFGTTFFNVYRRK